MPFIEHIDPSIGGGERKAMNSIHTLLQVPR